MVFELQRADGVRDALDRIRLAVREVVHRIDAPLVAGAMMLGVQDAVHDRIAHVEVRRRHVDLGPQRARAVGELAGLHAREEVEILFDGAIAIGAFFARLGERAAILAHLVGGQIADVGLAGLDELDGPLVELLEVVGRVKEAVSQSKPSQRTSSMMESTYSCSSFSGLVSSKRRLVLPPNSVGQAEVQADGLGVADVQIAVRLRRKARLHAARRTYWSSDLRG